MATQNFDASFLINAVLNALAQPQGPPPKSNIPTMQDIFGPSPSVPEPITPRRNEEQYNIDAPLRSRRPQQPPSVISVRDKKLLISLGLVLLKLHERGSLTTKVNDAIENFWDEDSSFQSFRDRALNNVQSLLGDEDGTLVFFDDVVFR